jgi:hypothetical protein
VAAGHSRLHSVAVTSRLKGVVSVSASVWRKRTAKLPPKWASQIEMVPSDLRVQLVFPPLARLKTCTIVRRLPQPTCDLIMRLLSKPNHKPQDDRGKRVRGEACSLERPFARPRRPALSSPPPRGQSSRPALLKHPPIRCSTRSERSKPRRCPFRQQTLPNRRSSDSSDHRSPVRPLSRAHRINAFNRVPRQCLPQHGKSISLRSPTTFVFGSSFPDRFCLPGSLFLTTSWNHVQNAPKRASSQAKTGCFPRTLF